MKKRRIADLKRWLFAWVGGVLVLGIFWRLNRISPETLESLKGAGKGLFPPGPEFALNAARSVGAVVYAAVFLLLCDAVGSKFLSWCLARPPRSWLRAAAAGVGYAAISSILLGMSCAGLWYPGFLLPALGLALVAAYRGIFTRASRIIAWTGEKWGGISSPARILWVLACVWWLPFMLAPEANVECMSYDLAFPQQILGEGRIFGTDLYLIWTVPLMATLPHVFALLLDIDPAARLVGVGLVGCGAIAFLRAMRAVPGSGVGAFSGLMAFTVPAGMMVLATAKGDVFALAYLLSAASVVAGWHPAAAKGRVGGVPLVAGFFLGAAVATKYILLPLAAALAFSIVFLSPRRRVTATLCLLIAGMTGPLLPWLLRGYLHIADPLYPMGSVLLPVIFGDQNTNAAARLLFDSYIQNNRSVTAIPVETLGLLLNSGFPFLAGLLLILAMRHKRAMLLAGSSLVGLAGMVLAIRFCLGHVERYTFPAQVLLNLLAIAAIWRLSAEGVSVARVKTRLRQSVNWVTWLGAVAAILGGLELVSPTWWRDESRPERMNGYFAGRLSLWDFRRQALGAYGEIQPILERRLRESKDVKGVLAIGEIFFTGIPARVRTNTDFEPTFVWRAARESDSLARLRIKFRQKNLGWLLYETERVYWTRLHEPPLKWTPRMLRLYADFAQYNMEPVAFKGCKGPGYGGNALYSICTRPSKAKRGVFFLPGAEWAFARGTRAASRGDFDLAIREYSELNRILPEIAAIRGALGHVLTLAGRNREAIGHLSAAAEVGPVTCIESVLMNRAIVAARLGRMNEVVDILRRAEEEYIHWPEAVGQLRKLIGRP